MNPLDDNSPVWEFRNDAYRRFLQQVVHIVWEKSPDKLIGLEAHRRYLQVFRLPPSGKQPILHIHLSWDQEQGDYLMIEFDNEEKAPVRLGGYEMTPISIANKILEILSQLNGTA